MIVPIIPRRLPPVIRGACRVVHAVAPLPDAGPPPARNRTLREVLIEQARALADGVEAEAPGLMESVRNQSISARSR
ncbi:MULTISPECIES: hypothetical protein [unclassified Methylobacterium]|uniref:hypothetical protein n=1 Tax=unclassified Methylobacterium TaxID=2615210 RepID=UPI0011C1EB49|nr:MULTISPECIES: hypothetical protein [unclassified Methylobacterium]QEE39917.1 hypothetical protein FVA80_14085 [Methylobacterium sp. WL1]TXN56583.1 hypothetical protein FV241_14740 [Methylobacterium sp. WL2]